MKNFRQNMFLKAWTYEIIRQSLIKLNLFYKQVSLNLAIFGKNGEDFKEKKIMFQ